jgi:hypothetical protein
MGRDWTQIRLPAAQNAPELCYEHCSARDFAERDIHAFKAIGGSGIRLGQLFEPAYPDRARSARLD